MPIIGELIIFVIVISPWVALGYWLGCYCTRKKYHLRGKF